MRTQITDHTDWRGGEDKGCLIQFLKTAVSFSSFNEPRASQIRLSYSTDQSTVGSFLKYPDILHQDTKEEKELYRTA